MYLQTSVPGSYFSAFTLNTTIVGQNMLLRKGPQAVTEGEKETAVEDIKDEIKQS